MSERRDQLTPRVEEWRRAGSFETVLDRRLFVHRRPAGQGPLLVFLHGFPSSSYDWCRLLALLPDRPALAFDFLGFGLSEKPRDHVYSLAWQADATEALARRAGGGEVFLVAHDMGTSVATELMARDLRGELSMTVSGALLFNGSILLDRASPTPGQRLLRSRAGALFARLTSETGFRLQFRRIFSQRHPLEPDDAADQWALIAHAGGSRILHRLIHYMDEREALADRWHGAFRDWPRPLWLAWGLRDPVATPHVLEGLRELRPGAPVTELAELGHYPQIEEPEAIADVIRRAVAQVESR